jgi:hypothetical protein
LASKRTAIMVSLRCDVEERMQKRNFMLRQLSEVLCRMALRLSGLRL